MVSLLTPLDSTAGADRYRPELLRLFDGLPPSEQKEVLDFTRFLWQQVGQRGALVVGPEQPQIDLRIVSVSSLLGMTGLVHWGGDAMVDTEALYDDDTGSH